MDCFDVYLKGYFKTSLMEQGHQIEYDDYDGNAQLLSFTCISKIVSVHDS